MKYDREMILYARRREENQGKNLLFCAWYLPIGP